MIKQEIWGKIDTFPDYLISSYGRVKSLRKGKNYGLIIEGSTSNGYKIIQLRDKNNNRKSITVHRLVALTFLSNPNRFEEIDHIDRNRSNNHVENLRWVNHSMNQKNKSCTKRVIKISDMKIYNCLIDAANDNNCSLSGVKNCCDNRFSSTNKMFFQYYDESKDYSNFKISDCNRGYKKKVINLTTNTVYDSIQDAADKTGINRVSISNCCNKKQKTTGKQELGFYDGGDKNET